MNILWLYNEKPLEVIPDGCTHFVYRLTFQSGEFYIGYKGFFSTRRIAPGKRRKTLESNWQQYKSSSLDVKQKLKNGEILVKQEILHLCKHKLCATWFELVEMIKHDVLCNPKALNKNILGRFYKCVEKYIN